MNGRRSARTGGSLTTNPPLDAALLADIPGTVDLAANGNTITFRTPDPRGTLGELTSRLEQSGNMNDIILVPGSPGGEQVENAQYPQCTAVQCGIADIFADPGVIKREAELVRHREYVNEHFEDLPEVRDWTWPG